MAFFDKMKARASEPSTYAGLALIAQGVGTVGQVNETAAAVTILQAVGQGLASGQGWWGVAMALLGAVAVLKGEKSSGNR